MYYPEFLDKDSDSAIHVWDIYLQYIYLYGTFI